MYSELEIDSTLHIISDDGCLKMSSMRENTSEPFFRVILFVFNIHEIWKNLCEGVD